MTARLVLVAVIASLALVGAYVALGGTSYRPTQVADPCTARPPAASDSSTAAAIQQVVLVAADATACQLGVSREDLVLALRSVDRLDALAAQRGVAPGELESAVRAGLVRAVDEAQREGLLGDRTAGVVRAAAKGLPIGLLLTLLRGASGLLGA